MVKGNSHFKKLKREYVFPIIEKKLEEIQGSVPRSQILNLGIGDISLPLAPEISRAIQQAVIEMSSSQVYGYGPSQGYLFLRQKIASECYPFLSAEEIFISDGINTDIVNILDIFHSSSTVAIPDPAYPAYLDSNLIAGRKKIIWMPCLESQGFSPAPPKEKVDLVYLCSPHNPTGVAMSKEELQKFVDYAKENESILLYDNAYEAFVTSPNTPKSIYEIPGADEVALEFRSFSKSAGFTGLRCSYLVLPKKITASFGRSKKSLHPLWLKRQSIKFNGVAYPIQRGAEACFTLEGKKQIQSQIEYYQSQAKTLKNGLVELGHKCFGGVDAPYIWWKTPQELPSWDFFDILLKNCHLISIPGSGFGRFGEGFVRLSAFISPSTASKALEKIKQLPN